MFFASNGSMAKPGTYRLTSIIARMLAPTTSADDIDDRHHRAGHHRRRRAHLPSSRQNSCGQPRARREIAVARDHGARHVQVQQQEADADHQQPAHEQGCGLLAPHAHRLGRQRVEEGPAAVRTCPTGRWPESSPRRAGTAPGWRGICAWDRSDVLAQEVPHDGGAGSARRCPPCRRHAGHQFVEVASADGDDLRLFQAHQPGRRSSSAAGSPRGRPGRPVRRKRCRCRGGVWVNCIHFFCPPITGPCATTVISASMLWCAMPQYSMHSTL